MKNRTRTKQTEEMVEFANQYLKLNHIRDESDDVFWFVTTYLLQYHMYKGFNYFKVKSYTDATGKTEKITVLAGSDKDFDFLQIY